MHAPGTGGYRWNAGGSKGVYTVNVNGEPDRFHQTQKPRALLEALIRDFTDYGDRVMDPYAGSATTLVSAKRMGRLSIGWEMGWGELSKEERAQLTAEQQVIRLEQIRRENFDRSARRLANTRQQIELAPPTKPKQVGLFSSR
jgi:DNA modification methylase